MPKLRPRGARQNPSHRLTEPDARPDPAGFGLGEKVTSAANSRIKLLKSLQTKKGRAESGLFLAEGARLLMEAAAAGHWPALIAFTEEAATRPIQRDYLAAARVNGAQLLCASERLLGTISQRDNPQALIGAFARWRTSLDEPGPENPPPARTPPLLARVSFATKPLFTSPENALFLALHEIRDPGNLGTIIRTADAVGADAVILLGACVDPFSVEAVRASMGAVFAVPILSADFVTFDRWRRARGARLVAGTLRGTMPPEAVDYSGPIALLMGNEQKGLPEAIEALVDHPVRIPMRGRADSLNLAVASGVMLYAAWRGRDYAET